MTGKTLNTARVLLTGDFQRPEFQAAVTWLRATANVDSCADLREATEHLGQMNSDPHLLIVSQSYPDQFSARQIEQLHRHAPLARIIALLGSWCEGEARSGRPWPGVMRLYWHQFESRLSPLVDEYPDFQTIANLPRTASNSEQLDRGHIPYSGQYRGLVAVRTSIYTDYEAIGESLSQIGYSNVWLNNVGWRDLPHATAIVWDCSYWDGSNPAQLAELSRLCNAAPVIALMNFPRHHDVVHLREAGVSAIVSRPFLIDDLQYQIDRVASITQPARQVA